MGNAKPNVVYILADDMGYGDLSCLNADSKVQTVHLDRMAADGMVFHDAHASSAVCTPSRYSIMTGRYNWRSKLKKGVLNGYGGPLIEEHRMTVASMLREQGYRTGCIGKWHLGWEWGRSDEDPETLDFSKAVTGGPADHGFDYYFGIIASLDFPPYVYVENDRPTTPNFRHLDCEAEGYVKKRYMRSGECAEDLEPEDVLPNFTRRACAFIEDAAAGDQPFFLYFPLPAPHSPILPTAEYRGTTGTNEYGDFCAMVDGVVGQVMAALEQAGVADNTVLAFAADNGCSPMADFDELHAVGHHPSYHFRGHKADIYEGGHRIPLVVRWPALIAAGSSSDQTVCLADLLATCADIVDTTLPPDAGEDSVSNLPIWRGDAIDGSLREATVHHSVNGAFSIRRGRWKLEMCPGSGGWSDPQPGEACRGLPPIQLYDLDSDIGETTNVADEHPDVISELQKLLTRYVTNGRSTQGPPQENAGGSSWRQLWWLIGGDPYECS